MARKTKIMGFSLPPEIYQEIENLLKTSHKTKSEFMRQVIESYLSVAQKTLVQSPKNKLDIDQSDANKILKLYYQLIGNHQKDTIVVGLGIIIKEGKVLIGQRKEKDPYVKELTWVFPGGKFDSLNFEEELTAKIKEETWLSVYVNQLIHARLIPDSPEKKVKIIAIYYHCTPVSGKENAGGDLKKHHYPSLPIIYYHYYRVLPKCKYINILIYFKLAKFFHKTRVGFGHSL